MSVSNGLCHAFTALQVAQEPRPCRKALSERDPLNLIENHHNHTDGVTEKLSTADASAAATSTTNNSGSGFLAGMIDAVLGLADLGSGKNNSSNNSDSNSVGHHSRTSTPSSARGGVVEDSGSNPESTYSRAEVRDHCSWDSCWMVINNVVYDATGFLRMHPGGEDIILEYGGHDATSAFIEKGHSPDAFNMLKDYRIGRVNQADWFPELNYT